jgi:inner membrane protein
MKKNSLVNSVWFRLCAVGVLTLLLLIPAGMVHSVIRERQQRYQDVFTEIASKWGLDQTLSGPVLTIPYQVNLENKEGKLETHIRHLHVLPDDLKMDARLNPELRYRGIYEVVVYNAEISVTGYFESLLIELPEESILWDEATLTFGVSDMRGIKKQVDLHWNERTYAMQPGTPTRDLFVFGISAKLQALNLNQRNAFKLALNLNGSDSLQFTPLGRKTEVTLASSWTEPSFTGNFLPVTREVDDAEGFLASYEIFNLNRSYPQVWTGNQHNISDSAFGVSLLVPVNDYQKTLRTAKYAILVIGLTFLSFFMIELLNRKSIHPIQYLLTGFALIVFYTLLLSLSEHLGFDLAYLLASAATLGLVTIYMKSILHDIRQAAVVGGVLLLLYAYLYFIIQLQDFALLIGSIGLFFILALVMYLTRKINWAEGMSPDED